MRVAVIGASKDRSKFGNKALRAYLSAGHEAFPVNPKEKEIERQKCYPSVLDAPGKLDAALLYLPPALGMKVLPEIAKKGVKTVYFNPGTESPELLKKARELGLEPVIACAIKAIGLLPSEFE